MATFTRKATTIIRSEMGWYFSAILQSRIILTRLRVGKISRRCRLRLLYFGINCVKFKNVYKFSELWIRIDVIRIRIQHFCSIRIRIQFRIQAKTELLITISFSNFFKSKFESNQIKKYRCYSSKFFPKSS
jgi:hypothetical protein